MDNMKIIYSNYVILFYLRIFNKVTYVFFSKNYYIKDIDVTFYYHIYKWIFESFSKILVLVTW